MMSCFTRNGEGEIINLEFHGAENLYTVRLPSGQLIRSSQSHIISLPLGTRVHTKCEAGHALTCIEGERAVICPQECDLPGLSRPRSLIPRRTALKKGKKR